jgi:hypothetical protein
MLLLADAVLLLWWMSMFRPHSHYSLSLIRLASFGSGSNLLLFFKTRPGLVSVTLGIGKRWLAYDGGRRP